MTWINSHNVRDLRTPFGGVKASGLGREGGQHSIDFYTESRIVHVALGDAHVPRFGVVTMAPGALPPPPDIVRAAYAELVVTDLARARWFWVDLLGFVVTDGPGALYLRGYDELTHHSLILPQAPSPRPRRLAYRVRSAADLDRAEASSPASAAAPRASRPGPRPGSARPSAPRTRSASPSSSSTTRRPPSG